MKIVTYSILYKNGHEDKIEQLVGSKTKTKLKDVNNIIYDSISNDVDGVITLGDGESKGRFIRLSDVSRVSVTYKKKLT